MARSTSFARWLRTHDETVSSFAIRTGLNNQALYFLAGRSPARPVKKLSLDVLAGVSRETGISERRLAGDAIVLLRNGAGRAAD